MCINISRGRLDILRDLSEKGVWLAGTRDGSLLTRKRLTRI